jgi:hypothetical protein
MVTNCKFCYFNKVTTEKPYSDWGFLVEKRRILLNYPPYTYFSDAFLTHSYHYAIQRGLGHRDEWAHLNHLSFQIGDIKVYE